MGTTWSVSAAMPLAGAPEALEQGIARVLAGVIAEMSNWEATSHISRFNLAPIGLWQALPADFLTVLNAALHVAARSGGTFDPTVGKAVDRWGFGPDTHAVAAPAESCRADWRALEINNDRARRNADVALDFSGIAKGFAVDSVVAYLKERGIAHALVEIGGELRGMGVRPDGQPWWVDIEAPPGLPIAPVRVALSGLSIATSGDYRRFFDHDGRRLAHSIDPRDGAPVENGIASVTVLHDSAMMADAWATAILVAGPADGIAMAEREGLATFMIARTTEDARERMSSTFAAMLD